MEIERKFIIEKLPNDLAKYKYQTIEQAYLCTEPVVRIRRSDDNYILTYKSKGFLSREEYNLPLTKESYEHLKTKADGNIISKHRYLIPFDDSHTIELDIFDEPFSDLIIAEVEFATESEAKDFIAPDWFGEDVTYDKHYHNNYLSSINL